MEMEWIAEAIENDGKLTERRFFFLKLSTRTVPYQKKSNQKCQLVASIWRLQRKHCTKFETKMMKIVVKSDAFTPVQTAKQVSQRPQWSMSLTSNTFADPPE